MALKRVVVTGLGALTPIGNSTSAYWESLVEGVSGAGPITHFDAEKFRTHPDATDTVASKTEAVGPSATNGEPTACRQYPGQDSNL